MSSMYGEDECKFMREWIVFNHCKVCVEIGVRGGRTTQYLCDAARANDGHVYGFDCWTIHGLKKQFKNNPHSELSVSKFLKQKGRTNFTLNTVDTTTQKFRDLIAEQCPKIDFAFIDGCHSYSGVKNDFDVVYPLLSPIGAIAFHDTLRIDGCREFILDLRTRYYDGTYDIIDMPWGFGGRRNGFSLLVKRAFPVVNLLLDEKCGSVSSPAVIIKRESDWYANEIKVNVPEKIEASAMTMDIDNLGKLIKR